MVQDWNTEIQAKPCTTKGSAHSGPDSHRSRPISGDAASEQSTLHYSRMSLGVLSLWNCIREVPDKSCNRRCQVG